MNQPPPRDPVICPIHNDSLDPPMVYIQTWDGRDHYECPQSRCTATINYPAASHVPHGSPAPQHPRQDPATVHDHEI